MSIFTQKTLFEEHLGAQEDQDALDEKIKEIVDQAKEFQTLGDENLHQKKKADLWTVYKYKLVCSSNN
jgi:hypothetical protein